MAMLGAMLSKDLGQRGNCPAHGGRAAGYACPRRTCPALPGLRQAHDHESAVRQHHRPGRGLVCRLFPLRGFPSSAWKRKGGLSGIRCGRQYAGHHQVPVLEDDLSERQRILYLHQSV